MMEMVNAFTPITVLPLIFTQSQLGGTVFLNESLPENFCPDGDGLGMYTHCLNCGGDGTYEGTQLEVKAESKEE